jgi:GT2 family glycosyltransferase
VTDILAGVVIVHFGDVDPTIRCAASVLGDPSRIERRVVVIDNSGNLEEDALVAGVEVISRPDNPGFGAAINVGVAALDEDEGISFYVVLNNDAVLGSGYLDAAADALEVGVGAVGGPIRDGLDTSRLWYAGGGINFLTGTVRQRRFADASGRGRDVGYIPATAMAVAKTAWRDIGGFDERFFLYNEDLDLCLRLRRAGWRLRFEPGMETFHRLGGSTGSAERSPLYLENLTATRFLPFHSRIYRMYLGGVHTVYNSLRVLGLCVRHTTGSAAYVTAVIRGHLKALGSVFS